MEHSFSAIRKLTLLASAALVALTALSCGELPTEALPPTSQSYVGAPTPPPYPPPATSPPPGPTAAPIPACGFAVPPEAVGPIPPLDAYVFSEPRVVLTNTSAIAIAGWLPDGRRLLVTLRLPDQAREYIATLNTSTGEVQRYGERHSFAAPPVWLAEKQWVAFADFSLEGQIVLNMSAGEGAPADQVANGLATPYLAASPDGRQVVFLTEVAPEQPQVFDLTQFRPRPLPFVLPKTPWQDLPALGQQIGPEPYRAAWSPDGKQLAFYNDTGFYLADTAMGKTCEVELERHAAGKRWAFDVQWSPAGRYLAALTTVGDPPVHFADLTLIDTATGELRRLDLGREYLDTMSWSPNGRDLLVVSQEGTSDTGLTLQGLYIIDATTGETRRMLADHELVGAGAWGISWSSTGREIALACPVVTAKERLMTEGRLCVISVEVRP